MGVCFPSDYTILLAIKRPWTWGLFHAVAHITLPGCTRNKDKTQATPLPTLMSFSWAPSQVNFLSHSLDCKILVMLSSVGRCSNKTSTSVNPDGKYTVTATNQQEMHPQRELMESHRISTANHSI